MDDATAPPVDPKQVKLVKNNMSAGVIVAGWKVKFPYAAGAEATIEEAKK